MTDFLRSISTFLTGGVWLRLQGITEETLFLMKGGVAVRRGGGGLATAKVQHGNIIRFTGAFAQYESDRRRWRRALGAQPQR